MTHNKTYKEFHTDQEVCEWVMKYFNSLINNMGINNKDSISELLYAYTGGMNMLYNQLLRGFREDFEKQEVEEYSEDIANLVKEISKFKLEEDIVVYRYTHKAIFKSLFKVSKVKIGRQFVEKGFMSTTMLPNLLNEFAKNHKYNCLLKLYLPKGTKGAYVSIGENKLNEYELLLPPDAAFKLLGKSFSIKYWMPMYECMLINQGEI